MTTRWIVKQLELVTEGERVGLQTLYTMVPTESTPKSKAWTHMYLVASQPRYLALRQAQVTLLRQRVLVSVALGTPKHD
jgi:hypothetical protein